MSTGFLWVLTRRWLRLRILPVLRFSCRGRLDLVGHFGFDGRRFNFMNLATVDFFPSFTVVSSANRGSQKSIVRSLAVGRVLLYGRTKLVVARWSAFVICINHVHVDDHLIFLRHRAVIAFAQIVVSVKLVRVVLNLPSLLFS